ncbi:hypothetical protein B7494_g3381 [Chlorociboria aeruginascens]|nr:hypothetical protein B7494_g3381 [Chlorociboria aeruginascens]
MLLHEEAPLKPKSRQPGQSLQANRLHTQITTCLNAKWPHSTPRPGNHLGYAEVLQLKNEAGLGSYKTVCGAQVKSHHKINPTDLSQSNPYLNTSPSLSSATLPTLIIKKSPYQSRSTDCLHTIASFNSSHLASSTSTHLPTAFIMCDWYAHRYKCNHTTYALGRYCIPGGLVQTPCKEKNIWQTILKAGGQTQTLRIQWIKVLFVDSREADMLRPA